MLLRLPAHPRSDPSGTAAAPSVQRLPVLLLGDPAVTAAVQGLLDSGGLALRLDCASTLGEAMIAAANHPPALAIIDAALCEALEREFLDHLLRTDSRTQVLLLHAGTGEAWAPHPRLTRVPPQAMRPAIAHWLAARAAPGERCA